MLLLYILLGFMWSLGCSYEQPDIQALDDKFEAAKSEKRDAMRSVELKRQEIDAVQVVINRVKNAISVQDINNRVSIQSPLLFLFFTIEK